MPAAERPARIEELLRTVGLPGHAGKYPAEMSGGMQQRLQIARCLAQEPKTLLMDEPFGALDAMTRQGLQDEVLSLVAASGATVIFVTHDLDEAIYLGDRVIGLLPHPGRIGIELSVNLPRPRDQLSTREHPEFLRLRPAQRVWKIVIPAALPRIFVAFRLSAGIALIVAVTVEIAINPLGLGAGIMLAQQALRPDLMLAYLVWIGIIGYALNILLTVAQQRLFGRAALSGDSP